MPSMTTTPKVGIFTDLDGCLLDRETYSFEPAQPALRLIRERRIPLILTSSKTRAEIELYRKKLGNDHPFIAENGGAIFLPKDYFPFSFPYDRETEAYLALELGTYYPRILNALAAIKTETGVPIRSFHDLTEEELTSLCGLSREEATLAKQREYDEPFLLEGGEKEREAVKSKIKEKGLTYVWGGRFHHILGKNDKGKAVEILKRLYEIEFHLIVTVGIGDSLNDFPMLTAVDRPILLKGEDPLLQEIPSSQSLTVIRGAGPRAWNAAVLQLLRS